MRRFVTGLLFIFTALQLMAQKATLRGNVADEKTGETIIGASVILDGTTIGAMTDFDGNFVIQNIPAGKYTVKCSFISYESKTEEIELVRGDEKTIDFKLGEAVVKVGEVKVVAKINRESENLLLMEQKKAVIAQQAIGAQEISRKGASDAEAAVTKVTGVAKQEGVKNIFVRGLGDRYNATTLNGFPVTSDDPEYKNISLDIFESDIIKAIGVNKVFATPTGSDVGGAEIRISSKELVGDGEFNASLSGKANSQTATVNFLISDGVSLLGFGQNTSSPEADESIYAFQNSLDPAQQNLQIGKGIGLSGGKSFKINKNILKFYLIGRYSNDFNYSDGITRETTNTGTVFRDTETKKYERTSSHLAMANLMYKMKNSDLVYNFLAIHTAVEGVRNDYGSHSEKFQESVDNLGLIRRQQNNINTLLVNQVRYNNELNEKETLNIGLAYNYTIGSEPDRRINYLSYEGNNMLAPLRGDYQSRYFGKLKERDINLQASLKHKFSTKSDDVSALEFGYKGRYLNDRYNSNSWNNGIYYLLKIPTYAKDSFRLDDFFNQANLDARYIKNKRYKFSTYTVDKFINSAYTDLVYQANPKLFINIGLKADIINLIIDYDVNDGAKNDSDSLNNCYFLPNLNIKYDFNDKNSFRIGASKTYTYPQSKEISPMLYEGPQWSSQGNPDLQPSTNYNLDLKWDYYPGSGEIISLTFFGKLIYEPIARVEINSSGGFLTYANIADKAQVGGFEFELRKNIFSNRSSDGNYENKLSFGINYSYLITEVETRDNEESSIPLFFTNKTTQLEGATPMLANGDISYNYKKEKIELSASAVVNYASSHIFSVGANKYNDVTEGAITTLDFIMSMKLNKKLGLSLKAKNLLNPEYQQIRKPTDESVAPTVLRSYKKGVGLSVGLNYRF